MHWSYCTLNTKSSICITRPWWRWYPAKRALPAMLMHGRWGPFSRILSNWVHDASCCVSPQAALLEDHMRELRRVIRPGSKRLNWNSLGINDFVSKCDSVSNSFFMHAYSICVLKISLVILFPWATHAKSLIWRKNVLDYCGYDILKRKYIQFDNLLNMFHNWNNYKGKPLKCWCYAFFLKQFYYSIPYIHLYLSSFFILGNFEIRIISKPNSEEFSRYWSATQNDRNDQPLQVACHQKWRTSRVQGKCLILIDCHQMSIFNSLAPGWFEWSFR